jgi:uncharacterized damage-inducible protein DinB
MGVEAMMNLQDVRTLLDYHYWARDRMLDAVSALTPEQYTQPLGNSFASIRDTLAHVLWADMIWEARWQGREPNMTFDSAVWPDVDSLRRAWSAHEQAIRALVERLGEVGIQQPIAYRSLNGTPSAEPFWQLVQHVVNHGTYHRGQVTTLLRQLGQRPAKSVDLITFYRERNASARA